jgi:ribosomal protein L30/L7E
MEKTINPLLSIINSLVKYYRERRSDAKKTKIDIISDCLDKDLVTCPVLKEILIAERDDQIFHRVYGYRLDSGRRKLLKDVVAAEDSPANWASIRAARPYLKVESHRLKVVRGRFEKVDYYIKVVFAAIFFAMSFGLMLVSLVSFVVTGKIIWSVALAGVFFLVAAVVLVVSTWGYSTACSIEEWPAKRDGQQDKQSLKCSAEVDP